jgi:hypothetical protein
MAGEDVDEYERRYMRPGERVLFRDKLVSRGAFHVSIVFAVVFGLAGLLAAAAALLGAAPLPVLIPSLAALAFAIFMGVGGAAFSVARTMLSATDLHVHFGWAKRKIPLDTIDAVSAVTTQGFKQGKVSVGLDGVVRTWTSTSASRRAAEIAYRDGKRRHILTIGSDRADALCAAIERARAAVTTGPGERVRFAADDEDGLAAAEAEAAAAQVDAERARR